MLPIIQTLWRGAWYLRVKHICAFPVSEQEAAGLWVYVDKLSVPSADHVRDQDLADRTAALLCMGIMTETAGPLSIMKELLQVSESLCYLVESVRIRLYFSGCPLERTTMQDVLRLALGSKVSRPGLQLRES